RAQGSQSGKRHEDLTAPPETVPRVPRAWAASGALGGPLHGVVRGATVAARSCSMENMKSSSMATAAAGGLLAVLIPATATAKVIGLGVPSTALVAPTCPPNVPATGCTIVLTESTALETIRDSVAYPTTVKKAGMIVAFTIGLSKLDTNRKK